MNVLIVEPSKEERRALAVALDAIPTVVLQGAVPDIEAALDAVADRACDLLITGLELGDGVALDLIAGVHELAPAARIVVIGDATREQWRRHLAAGADRFVARDPALAELRDVVAALAAPRELETCLQRLTAIVELLTFKPEDDDLLIELRDSVDDLRRVAATLRGARPPRHRGLVEPVASS